MINTERLKSNSDKLIDIAELTEVLGISQMSIYRMRYKGELLPKAKWGGKNYWDCKEVMEYCVRKGVLNKEVELV